MTLLSKAQKLMIQEKSAFLSSEPVPTFLFTSWKVTNEQGLMFEQTVWIKYLLTYLHVYSIRQTFKL